MDTPDAQFAYALQERMHVTSCDGPGSPSVSDELKRESLLLVSSTMTNNLWQREMCEYPVAFGSLHEILGGKLVARDDLAALGDQAAAGNVIDIGAGGAIIITSDRNNSAPVLTEKEAGIEPLPIAHSLLHLPTVVPGWPDDPVTTGRRWQWSVRIAYLFGEFDLPYSAGIAQASLLGRRVSIALQETEIPCAGVNAYLVAAPTGTWAIDLPVDGILPTGAAGNVRFVFRGICTEGAKVVTFEALDSRAEFHWRAIPAHFDEEIIDARCWLKDPWATNR
jgi:hypothetical protein